MFTVKNATKYVRLSCFQLYIRDLFTKIIVINRSLKKPIVLTLTASPSQKLPI